MHSGRRSGERYSPAPMSRGSAGRTVRTVRIGSFTTNIVADGAGVSAGDVQARVSKLVFRRLHAWTLKERSAGSQPVGGYPQVPRRFRASREVRSQLVTTASGASKRPRRDFPWPSDVGIRLDGANRFGRGPICARRPVRGISRPESRGFPLSKYKGFPRSSSKRRWRYCMCPVAQSARSRAEPSSASPKARRAKETHR